MKRTGVNGKAEPAQPADKGDKVKTRDKTKDKDQAKAKAKAKGKGKRKGAIGEGAALMLPVDHLKPTQITVGAFHVAQKIHVTRRLSHADLPAFLDKHRIHVVLGPEQVPYVVDHHHWVRAWHEMGIAMVPAVVRADLSHLSTRDFWKYMVANHMVHPYDEHGKRVALSALPPDIHGMRDDPYRSIEAFVQLAGGYRKVKAAYPDFRWADFFRKHIDGPFDTHHGFASALARAVQLALGKKARGLPGYIGP
ncbi:ParB/Srx family N-terminal domain-containing protein [Cupriavidus agavae]|uniref:ParB/Srx family N-terminal domain-containing protein n=1 Tax=Cupriavidus agavae TaxID=1001822 RepID=UPI002E25476E